MNAHTRQFRVLAPYAAAFVVLLLAATPSAVAQQASASEKEEPRSGPSDGIKVHGHWTIDIKNADGTQASHHEFENALGPDGAAGLSSLLGHGGETLIGWGMAILGSSQETSPCIGACVVVEPVVSAYNGQSAILNVTAPTSGPNAGKIVLSASVTALTHGDVGIVFTDLFSNPPGCAPGTCFTDRAFSQRLLSIPIGISAGQIMQVTVVLSFS